MNLNILQCQDFDWFLKSVMKPADLLSLLEISNIVGAGEIKNEAQQNGCLDADQINASINLTSCTVMASDSIGCLQRMGECL